MKCIYCLYLYLSIYYVNFANTRLQVVLEMIKDSYSKVVYILKSLSLLPHLKKKVVGMQVLCIRG